MKFIIKKNEMKKYLLFLFSIITLFCILLFAYNNDVHAYSNQTYSFNRPYNNNYDRLFNDDILHHLTVYITNEEWTGVGDDMIEYKSIDERMKTGNYRKAILIYEDEFGIIEFDNIGIRTRGNTTRIIPQDEEGNLYRAHFAISFDETFNLQEGTQEYEAIKNREFCSLEKLNLKWNNWTDISHIRELYSYEKLNEAKILAPNVSLATLTINIDGRQIPYGVYTIIEPIDKKFLKKRFGKRANDGNLYKCLWEEYGPATLEKDYPNKAIGIKDWNSGYRPSYDLKTNKTIANTSDIIEFIDNINNLSDEEFAIYIDDVFEVDRLLRLLAMNVLLGSCDDYRTMGNNYYLYFNNIGKIDFIPYDYDAVLGGGWGGEPAWTYEGIANADIYTYNNFNSIFLEYESNHPLVDRILLIDEYRNKYEYYLASFIDNEIFSYNSFLEKFTSLEHLYSIYASSDTMDTGMEMKLTNEQWYFETKISSVKKQLED